MRVLVSTSDKTGLVEFLKPLLEKNAAGQSLELISTGGTYDYLKKNNFKVTEVSEVTKFPEVLDGRVKTLHPVIHMGLLADKDNQQHLSQLKEHNILAFDMVIGNLYPFEAAATKDDITTEELIEFIDIGGPSFLRSSAKNFKSIIVLSSPTDYSWVQEKLLNKSLTLADRKKLAIKVFSLTSYYDSLIVERLSKDFAEDKPELNYLNIPLKKKMQLRYGENSHQQAAWYCNPLELVNLNELQVYQGKELSYNNLLDLDAAIGLVRQLDAAACVAIKHNNPCGVAVAEDLFSAALKTIQSDPKSIFGGIIAFNKIVDLKTSELFKDIFLECIIAPEFTIESLQQLSIKKNLRVLSFKHLDSAIQHKNNIRNSFKSVLGGVLIQQADSFDSSAWSFLGKKPDSELLKDMIFGEKVAAALKSNAIAIVANGQTVGLGMGQVNRVDAVRQALDRMLECKGRFDFDLSQAILVSDAFFPFADSIDLIAQYGIKWILQPGGSVQDEKIFTAARDKNVNMTITKKRHFKH